MPTAATPSTHRAAGLRGWCYLELIGGGKGLGEAKQAMLQRADFLAAQVAKDIAAETDLEHRPITDGQRVVGIYRRSVMLASG